MPRVNHLTIGEHELHILPNGFEKQLPPMLYTLSFGNQQSLM